jgi:hypothetical protein
MYRSFGFVVLGLSGVAISEITAFAYPELFPVSGFASTLPLRRHPDAYGAVIGPVIVAAWGCWGI